MTMKDLRFCLSAINALEAQNAELRANLEDARKQNEEMRLIISSIKDELSIFDALVLYPTYIKLLKNYPESQKEMVELSIKANFFKSSYEIKQKTWAYMVERWSKRSGNAE
ncbi:hypothetical protein SUGI_0059470 [Cryptomeria japonica]|nr:hypothetical protein SUGI_0059470 [Cryptomeria japonica]